MEANPKPTDHLPAGSSSGRMYRTSLSLPADLAVQLNRVAKRLAVSQSALAQLVMEEPLRQLEGYIEMLPKEITNETASRFRGEAALRIRRAVRDALAIADELDTRANR